jgi:hypothetical protein
MCWWECFGEREGGKSKLHWRGANHGLGSGI